MNAIKKQKLGTWLTLVVIILGIVSVIIYSVNGSVEGYFKGTNQSSVVIMSVLAIVLAVVSIILAQFSPNGAAGKILSAITDILRIAAAVLLIASLMGFVSTRVEGLGYIFGSDENVLDEIQTEENMRSAYTAIAGFAFYAVTWLVALVACFCGMTKAAKKTNA